MGESNEGPVASEAKMVKECPARVTISRPTGSGPPMIHIEVLADDPRVRIVCLEMSPADFAMAVTGRGEVPARAELWDTFGMVTGPVPDWFAKQLSHTE